MPLLDLARDAATSASHLAAANWAANRAALATNHPHLAGLSPVDHLTFTYARDGSLTAVHPDGAWHLSCSVPRAAAKEMLKSLDARGNVACFLDPRHAAALRVALDKLLPEQAIIAVAPDVDVLRILLHCDDFSAEFLSGRLFFAAGADWPAQLSRLLRDHEGLPTPALFIKTPLLPQTVAEEMIASAQRVLSEETSRRTSLIDRLRAAPRKRPRHSRICAIAPSRFRLWDNPGQTLAGVLSHAATIVPFDPDTPTTASPLALAHLLSDCDAMVTANTARSDLPPLAADALPWITWVTSGRIPAVPPAARNDHLLLADPTWRPLALAAGWTNDRVHVATWPPLTPALPQAGGTSLALLADTAALTPPPDEMDLSSHSLLWEAITDELQNNPLAALADANAYLTARMRRHGIAEEGLDRNLFLARLILPAYQQGLARLLLSANLPLHLHGQGWSDVPDFAPHAAGPITSRESFDAAITSAAALVHAWPVQYAHPIDAINQPILRPSSTRDALLHAARNLLRNPSPAPPKSPHPLAADRILCLLSDSCPAA